MNKASWSTISSKKKGNSWEWETDVTVNARNLLKGSGRFHIVRAINCLRYLIRQHTSYRNFNKTFFFLRIWEEGRCPGSGERLTKGPAEQNKSKGDHLSSDPSTHVPSWTRALDVVSDLSEQIRCWVTEENVHSRPLASTCVWTHTYMHPHKHVRTYTQRCGYPLHLNMCSASLTGLNRQQSLRGSC